MGLIDSKELLELVERVVDEYTIHDNVSENKSIPVKLLKKIVEKLENENKEQEINRIIRCIIFSSDKFVGESKLINIMCEKKNKNIDIIYRTKDRILFTDGELWRVATSFDNIRGNRFNDKVIIDKLSLFFRNEHMYSEVLLHCKQGAVIEYF